MYVHVQLIGCIQLIYSFLILKNGMGSKDFFPLRIIVEVILNLNARRSF